MIHNEVIDIMLKRPSVRNYTDQRPGDEVIETIVRAGQQAPFAALLGSVLLTRKGKLPWGAPIMFTICMDMHRMELIMVQRGWKTKSSDLSILLFGLQDATLRPKTWSSPVKASAWAVASSAPRCTMRIASRRNANYQSAFILLSIWSWVIQQRYYRRARAIRWSSPCLKTGILN